MTGREESAKQIEDKLKIAYADYPILEEYRVYMRIAGLEPKTREFYLRLAHSFLESTPKDLSKVTPLDISIFLDKSKKEGEVQTYLRTVWYSLKRFFTFYTDTYGGTNPVEKTPRPKAKPSREINRVYLTPDECKEYLETIQEKNSDAVICARDTAIVEIFLETGIRASALREINLEDIDHDKSEIRITDKGHKTTCFPVSDHILSDINSYINLAREHWDLEFESGPLFYSRRGQRISYDVLRQIAAKYAKGKHITPHKFRASFATNLYNATGDIQMVQECMNHANISTTQIYVQSDGRSRRKASNMISNVLYDKGDDET